MFTATPTSSIPASSIATIDPPATGDIGRRLAGAGAIGFAAIVVLQNVIRGGSAPTNSAGVDEVLAYYADHRSLTFVLVATFVAAGACLAGFLGGVFRRLATGTRPASAIAGYVGATGVMALFALVVGTEQAMSVVATGDDPQLGAISGLWALHNGVFVTLYLMLAVALVGLARAGVGAGITPAIFDRLAPIGGGLLLVGAVAGPAIAAGDAMPAFGAAGLGFLVWLAFLVTTGLRLLRSRSAS